MVRLVVHAILQDRPFYDGVTTSAPVEGRFKWTRSEWTCPIPEPRTGPVPALEGAERDDLQPAKGCGRDGLTSGDHSFFEERPAR